VVPAKPAEPQGDPSQCGRCHGAADGGAGVRIGNAVRDADDHGIGLEARQVGGDRQAEEGGIGREQPEVAHGRQPSRRSARAGAAAADDRDVADVHLEAVGRAEGVDDAARLGLPDLPVTTTGRAVAMPMLVAWPDVELLPPIGPVPVADEPELLEDVERPVDGGRDGRRVDRTAALDQLGAGDVAIRLGEHVDHRPALRCPAHPSRPEAVRHGGPGVGW